MTKEELLAKRQDLYKTLIERENQINAEKRIPSEEERTWCDQTIKEIGEITNQLEAEDLNARIAETRKLMEDSQRPPARPSLKKSPQGGDGFRSFGDQMKAIFRAAQGHVDSRLEWRAATGMSEGVPADGGFLVEPDFATELLRGAVAQSQVFSRIRKIPISGNSNGLKINAVAETSRANGSRFGGVRGYWLNEAGQKTSSKPTFRQIELSLKKLIGLCYMTDELLEDAAALEAFVKTAFAEEFAFLLDDAGVNGNGAGMPLGIMNSGCLVSVTRNTASQVNAQDIVGMWARMYAPYRTNAVWYINQDVEPQLYQMDLSISTAGGQLVYMPPGGLSQAPYATLMGRPVIPIEQCQTMGTSGDIILADPSQIIGIEKGGIQSASSIHVRFVNDETAFRFVYRTDFQPWWVSALTPFKGSNSLSPFVVLT